MTGGTGLLFANTYRATNVSETFVRGFGADLHLDAFAANIGNVWLQSGNTQNLRVGLRCIGWTSPVPGSMINERRAAGTC